MKPEIDTDELQRIYEEAAHWILCKEDGDLSASDYLEYEAWLKRPHHADALKQMQEFCNRFEQPWRRRRLNMRLAAQEGALVAVPTLAGGKLG